MAVKYELRYMLVESLLLEILNFILDNTRRDQF